MLHNEMSKAYLHHSFVYGQESTHCVVHVLLAALYYKSGHYQTAIDHCKHALNQCDREQSGSRCIGAEYLPQIDESVDAVFGLVLLYKHVLQQAVNSNKMLQAEHSRSHRTPIMHTRDQVAAHGQETSSSSFKAAVGSDNSYQRLPRTYWRAIYIQHVRK